jgi:hypothetical protein
MPQTHSTTIDRDNNEAEYLQTAGLDAPYRLGLEDGREGAPHDPPAGWAARMYSEGYSRGFAEWLARR